METRIYHGEIKPRDIARGLIARFHRGNLTAQQIGGDDQVVVQITTRRMPTSGGQTALTVNIQRTGDGVAIQIGKQQWLGVAASLGATALFALRNPMSLLGRLDDLAQDIEHLQLSDSVWEVVEEISRLAGATHELSDRLRTLTCEYCTTANPVAEPRCVACGAPLGLSQPRACHSCGFVVGPEAQSCPNCGKPIELPG
jgi:hypothetical protein